MKLNNQRKSFLESLTEEDKNKFFGIPVHEKLNNYFKNETTTPLYSTNTTSDQTAIQSKLVINTSTDSKCSKLKKKLIIDHDCRWKLTFDMIVIILTGFSCMLIVFYATFKEGVDMNPIHYIVEALNFIAIILHFFHKYQDPDTLEIVSSYKKIALNYILSGWCLIDIVSIVPYELFSSNINLFKLMRLIRLLKLIELINIARFDKLIDSLFSNSKSDKLIIMFNIRYSYKIIRLIIIASMITYLIGCFWYIFCDNFADTYPRNFISNYNLAALHDVDKLIICCYFVLTTLTTVGYGDYVAANNAERIFAIVIMILGVAFFSYVMGSFTDLITSYDKKIGFNDKDSELQNWLTLLSKFSKRKPIGNKLIKQIGNHFAYFWANDRNASMSKKDEYLKFLPKTLRLKLVEFLWGDVLNNFSNFFFYYSSNKDKFFDFYFDVSYCLMPRKFLHKEFLYLPEEEVEEMYLISEGSLEIGFSLSKENDMLASNIKYCKVVKSFDWIGEFYCLFNTKSQFYYTAGSDLKAFGINKYDLVKALEKHQELFTKFKTKAYRRYHDYFKVILEGYYNQSVNNENYAQDPQTVTEEKLATVIKSKLEITSQEIEDVIHQIEKKFVRLDDDYVNISRHLFDMSLNCERDLLKMNFELDEVRRKLILI